MMKYTMEEVAKKIWPWVKMILATIVSIAGVIGTIFVACLLVKTLLGYSPDVEDKYVFFKDILVINLSIIAIIFGAIIFWIHLFISERVENRVGDRSKYRDKVFFKYTLGTSQLNNGYTFWLLYQSTQGRQYLEKPGLERQYLNIAIDLTEDANYHFKGLDEKVYAYQLAKCQTMNNLGYYLAERGKPEDIQYAITCAEFILKRIESFPEHRGSWIDTYEFIRSKKGTIKVPLGSVA